MTTNLRPVCRWLPLVVLAAGCATAPKTKPAAVVFPAPPDEPRIQYLASFGSESDLGGRGRFAEFVVGAEQRVHRPIWKPYGVATAPGGQVFVCDTQAANVAKVDLVKRTLRYLKPPGEAALRQPINIVVDTDGTKYVTDTKRKQVLIYDARDQYRGSLGEKDEMNPCGLARGGDRLYVTDLKNRCVRVYRKADRQLLFTVPRDRTSEAAQLFAPTNIAVDKEGAMYVADSGGFVVQLYNADGTHRRLIGEQGLTAGRFALPKGIGVDRVGRFYVVDAATAVVQVFAPDGRVLMHFGYPAASGPGALYLPAGLAIDYDNVDLFQADALPGYRIEFLILVVNQAGPNKVSIYGFLRKK